MGLSSLLTFTRASTASYTDANGAVQQAAVDEARYDHDPGGNYLGLLIQSAALAGAVELLSGPLSDAPHVGGMSVIVNARTHAYSDDQPLWQHDDGSANNLVRLLRDNANHLRLQAVAASTQTVDIDLGAIADATTFIVAVRIAAGEYAASLDGAAVQKVTAALPAGLTTRRIGNSEPYDVETNATFDDASAWTLTDTSTLEFVASAAQTRTWGGHIVRVPGSLPPLNDAQLIGASQ